MSSAITHWQRIQVGDPISELIVRPDCTQVFMFSAVTWNRHHIHFSKDAALSEGLPDVVVQRGLIGNFMARQVEEWIEHGELVSVKWRMMANAVPGDTLKCTGVVTDKEQRGPAYYVDCSLSVTNASGHTISRGDARVRIANPSSVTPHP